MMMLLWQAVREKGDREVNAWHELADARASKALAKAAHCRPFNGCQRFTERETEHSVACSTSAYEHELPEEHHVNKLVLGNGVVHHSHETWLMRGITFCGMCGAWGTSAPRLLTKAWTSLPKTRASELKRLSKGLEPNRRTVWPSDTPVLPRRIYIDCATHDFSCDIIVISLVTSSS